MIIGIDASNIRATGAANLNELLRVADPLAHGFDRIIIWIRGEAIDKVDDMDWLCKVHEPLLDRSMPFRLFWQRLRLKKLAEAAGCDVLYVLSGSDASGFKPMVTISQNLLPFEWREMRRFGLSLYTLKFLLLRWTQSNSFHKADGLIFLTQYARNAVLKVTGPLRGKNVIIPHGINPRFFQQPRTQRLSKEFDHTKPCRVLYVSVVDVYKHQCMVATAVAQLRSSGVPIILELIGPASRSVNKLKKTINRIDSEGAFINYRGAVPHEELHKFYKSADIGIFASSCENLPNILLEGMAAGLPMACSSMGPMPEVLGDAGVYFNPENSHDIARALSELINSSDLRVQFAQAAFERAQQYSWKESADKTFDFLAKIANKQIGI